MPKNPLPSFVSSLSKYHKVEDHFHILLAIQHDMPIQDLVGQFHADLLATARQRYLLMKHDYVLRDKLIDLAHEEGSFTERMKTVMYFLFMFRDSRYRDFICDRVGADNGKWQTSIFRSSRTDFFERAGGIKAFTNLRRFLFHTGILNEQTFSARFPDLQLWFPSAVSISAQYLQDEHERRDFLASPHGFLIRHKLNALVNVTPEELALVSMGGTYEEADDLLPQIDLPTGKNRIDTFDFQRWNRIPPSARKNRELVLSSTDPTVLERANQQHYLLELDIVGLCSTCGFSTESNIHVDVLAQGPDVSILFEMKSSNSRSTRSQIRRALSQLLEYRYLYRDVLRKNVQLCIVIERKPKGPHEWLIDYVSSLGIGIIWKNDDNDLYNCSDMTRQLFMSWLPQLAEKDFSLRKR